MSGWDGDEESGFLLFTPKNSYLLTDFRYTEHASASAPGFKVIEISSGHAESLSEILTKEKIAKLGFESKDLSVHSFQKFKQILKQTKMVAVGQLVEEIREVKSSLEVEKLKAVASLGDAAFAHILKIIKPGLTESDLSWELSKFMREKGAQGNAWEPLIVAVGTNSSMAHYSPGNVKIKKGDMVLLDFGASLDGYTSDMTRVVFIGQPTSEQKRIYEAVLSGQKIGIAMVKAGEKASIIDEKVRSYLQKVSPKGYYRHGLGHGIGIEVHELPAVSSRAQEKLKTGNVITIEPGIYIPNWGGVRIEDMVLVTQSGHEVLTKSPKEIQDVTV